MQYKETIFDNPSSMSRPQPKADTMMKLVQPLHHIELISRQCHGRFLIF